MDKLVALRIHGERREDLHYQSEISVVDESSGSTLLLRRLEGAEHELIDLGRLGDLKNSVLAITSTATRDPNNQENANARLTYQISYEGETVEETTVESSFRNQTTAFLHFRFKFCPRFPFC